MSKGKRLVLKQLYIKTLLAKGGLYSASFLLCVGALVFLVTALLLILTAVLFGGDGSDAVARTGVFLYAGGFGALCLASIWLAVKMFNKAEKIEEVALISRHNIGDLPEVETLVRGSAPSATAQQNELLRAAGPSTQTPPQILLRATVENR